MKHKQLSILMALLAGVQLVVAQGTTFTFQGRLNDDSLPATGVYDLEFTLWNAAAGPSQIGGTVTVNDLPVTNGLLTAPLDFGAGAFEGSARWLQIAVRPGASGGGYTPLTPRTQVLPSPYAIYAGTAATASTASSVLPGAVNSAGIADGTITVTDLNTASVDGRYVLKAGDTMTGPLTTPNLTVPGVITASSIQHPPLSLLSIGSGADIELTIDKGGGAFSYFEVFNGAGSHVFHVDELGNSRIYGNLTADGSVTAANFIGSGAGLTDVWHRYGDNVGPADFLGSTNFVPVVLKANNQIALRLFPAGATPWVVGGHESNRVTLGATYGATIGGGGYSDGPNLVSDDWGTVAGGYGNIAGNTNGVFDAQGGAVGGGYFNQAGGAYATVPGGYSNFATGNYSFAAGNRAKATNQGAFVWADSQAADFASTANNQFLIRAAGNVGINKNSPGTALDVNGTVTATGFVGPGAGLTGVIPADNSVASAKIADNTITALDIGPDAVGASEIAANAVGTSEIADGSVSAADLANDDGSLSKVTAGTMTDSGSSIGIGTATPTSKLHIFDGGNDADLTIEDEFPFLFLNRKDTSGNSGISFQDNGNWAGWLFLRGSDRALVMSAGTSPGAQNVLVVATNENVGIGTASPAAKLDVLGMIRGSDYVAVDGGNNNNGALNDGALTGAGLTFGAGLTGEGIASKRTVGGNQNGLDLYTAFLPRLRIASSGNVTVNNNLAVNGNVSVNSNLTVNGNARVAGLVRLGSEASAAPPSYPDAGGMVIRRVASLNTAISNVVARTDTLTLERDGTYGGLLIRWQASPGFYCVANATGVTTAGAQVAFHNAIGNPGAAGTVTVFSDAQNVSHYDISFGNPYSPAHLTHVVLERYDGDYYIVGTVTSSYNQ